MVFSSLFFLFTFLPVTLILYYIVPFRLKNTVLLLCSLVFYAWGEPVYVILMILNIIFNYIMGIDIEINADNTKRKKASLILSIAVNVSLLGFFKYYGFLMENVNAVFNTDIQYKQLGLPIGISFYTFQILSYIIDVYKGEIKAQKNPLLLGVYVTMFPQLVAGPIVQYADIEKQLASREISRELFGAGSRIFITGLAKKVLLANSAGSVFETLSAMNHSDMSVMTGWIICISYTFQIYFDFSGYSDMAIGLGKMLGFDFKPNFDYPYISRSASEFWRRWHISLGSWFRDYIYIPLGGSYVPLKLHIRNIFAVWMLTGLWHGASWNFVIWGLYYGIILLIEKYLIAGFLENRHLRVLQHVYTLIVVMIGWVIFSSSDITAAGRLLSVMFGFGSHALTDNVSVYYTVTNIIPAVFMAVGSTPAVAAAGRRLCRSMPAFEKAAVPVLNIVLLLMCTAYLVNETYNPFLYFRF